MVLSRYVGAEVKRKEDPRLITGSSMYVDDLQMPGMAHVALYRSPYPHARITGIDTSAAEGMPGVIAVLTGDQLAEFCAPMAAGQGEGGSHEQADFDETAFQPSGAPTTWALARGKVRNTGEAVVAVVAETRYQAEDAVAAVVVDFQELPNVTNPEDAMKPGAPQIFDHIPFNVGARWDRKHGNPDEAFANAAVVAKGRIRSQRVSGVPMEPRAVAAAPDPLNGGLTVWTSTQAPHWNRSAIAGALGIPTTKVRAIAPEVGGGFGVKIGAYQEDLIVAALAWKLKRPLKWQETRSENFLATHHGRDQWADVEICADRNGKLQGIRMRVVQDLGSHAKGNDLAELTGRMSAGCYEIPNLDFRSFSVYTNTMAVGAYRGAGRPEAAYYVERAIDMLADAGGWDPAELRSKNFIAPFDHGYVTAAGEKYDTGDYDKPLKKALDLIGYADLRKQQSDLRKQGRYIGIGIASYVEICGFGPFESATVRVEPNGDVTLYSGISPHGQGQETTFAQLAADWLGADYDKVIFNHSDTLNTPQGNGTMGSRGLAVGGGALAISLKKIQDRAKAIAAQLLEAAADDIELSDGKYRVKGSPAGEGLSLADISGAAYSGALPAEFEAGLESTDFFRPEDETFPFGTHIAVVEVFPDTGEVKLTRFLSVDDCGVIISPMLVRGQVHGGLAQGIGQALFEEITYGENGELLSGTLNDYALPRAWAFPTFETHHTETPTYINALGAKGIGEAATIGSTPATANAVIDALEPWGVTNLDIPLTAEKVWRAIQAGASSRAAD